MPNFDQKNFILASFTIIAKEYLSPIFTSEDDSQWWQADLDIISSSAALIRKIVGNEQSRTNQVISWMTSSSGAGVGEGIAIRRATIAALAKSKSDIEMILEKSLQQFGDQLYIRHTPAMQQDGRFLGNPNQIINAKIMASPCTSSSSFSWICTPDDTDAIRYDDKIRCTPRTSI